MDDEWWLGSWDPPEFYETPLVNAISRKIVEQNHILVVQSQVNHHL